MDDTKEDIWCNNCQQAFADPATHRAENATPHPEGGYVTHLMDDELIVSPNGLVSMRWLKQRAGKELASKLSKPKSPWWKKYLRKRGVS